MTYSAPALSRLLPRPHSPVHNQPGLENSLHLVTDQMQVLLSARIPGSMSRGQLGRKAPGSTRARVALALYEKCVEMASDGLITEIQQVAHSWRSPSQSRLTSSEAAL